MRKSHRVFFSLAAVLALLPVKVFAAQMSDLAKDWTIRVSETLTLSKSGAESLAGDGTWTFSETDARTGTLAYTLPAGSGGGPDDGCTGLFAILGNGKKLSWNLDAGGLEQLRARLKNWIEAQLETDGLVLQAGGLTLDLSQASSKPIKVAKATNQPESAVLSAKGKVNGTADGAALSRKFKYSCAITFTGIKPPQEPSPTDPPPPPPPPPQPPRPPEVDIAIETSDPTTLREITIAVNLTDPDGDLATLECDCNLNGKSVLRQAAAVGGSQQSLRYTIEKGLLEPAPLTCSARVKDAGGRTDADTDSKIVKAACPLYGIAFSPYRDGQSPNFKTPIGEPQIRERLGRIAGYTEWIRTFGMLDGLEKIPAIARTEFGLKVAAGIWLDGRYAAENEAGLQNLIAVAKQGYVDVAVIGNETLLFKRLDSGEEENAKKLIEYIGRFRQAVPGVPVTTADNYTDLLRHPNVMAACDRIFANIYPFHMQVPVADAACRLAGHYFEIKAAAAGKPVVVSETGWPTCGDPKGGAVPGPANAAKYFLDLVTWAEGENVPYFYFEAFDEAWKTEEGTVGPCWGVWTQDAVLKPGMPPVFGCATSGIDCDCTTPVDGPGSAEVAFSAIPPYGDPGGVLTGQVRHVVARDFRIAVYIKVDQGWWVKPSYAAPATAIACDGRFSVATVTGGLDYNATAINVYLIPAGYTPPAEGGVSTPPPELHQNALVVMSIARSPSGVSVTQIKP